MLSRVGAYRGTRLYDHAILESDQNNFELVRLEISEGASITAQLRERSKTYYRFP